MTKEIRDFKWMEEAEEIAIGTPRVSGAQLGSILVLKNKLISSGRNSYRTHPLAVRFGKNAKSICIHAELSSLIKATKFLVKEDFKQSTLYICRVKHKSQHHRHEFIWGNAYPCNGCIRAISFFKIRRVVYSVDNEIKSFQVIE